MSKGNPGIHVRFDRETLVEIQIQAAAVGISVPELVRMIVYAWLEVHS